MYVPLLVFFFYRFTSSARLEDPLPPVRMAERLYEQIREELRDLNVNVKLAETSISVESVLVKVEGDENEHKRVYVSWANQDEHLGSYILDILQKKCKKPLCEE